MQRLMQNVYLHDGLNEGQRSIVDGEYTKMTHEFHRRPFIYRQDFKAAKQAAPQENKWTHLHICSWLTILAAIGAHYLLDT